MTIYVQIWRTLALWFLSNHIILYTESNIITLPLSTPIYDHTLVKRFGLNQNFIKNKYSDLSMGLKKRTDYNSSIAENIQPINLYNDGNIAYYLPITVGSPPQEFNVLVDTAADILWIPSSTCIKCKNFQYFQSNQSSTYINSTQVKRVALGSGVITGHLSQDTVRIGEATVYNQSILVASFADQFAQAGDYGAWDGVIGFTLNKYPQMSSNYNNTWIQNMFTSGNMSSILGLRLSLSLNGTRQLNGGGDLTIGGVNRSHFVESLIWLDVVRMPSQSFKLYWTLNLTAFDAAPEAFIDKTVPYYFDNTTFAILDTGATFIYMDTRSFNSFFFSDKFPVTITKVDGLYTVTCADVVNLPVLAFYLNGTPFKLYAEDYIIRINGECILGISHIGNLFPNQVTWVLGAPFLRRYYTAYSFDDEKIGISIAVLSYATKTAAMKLGYILPVLIVLVSWAF